jgi:hypothetical protein
MNLPMNKDQAGTGRLIVRELPPNHLRIRIGTGNRIFNNHVNFIQKSERLWLTFLSREYCTSRADVVELGCGCGGIARALRNPWFDDTYVGVDIDNETIEYCRNNFPADVLNSSSLRTRARPIVNIIHMLHRRRRPVL